MPTPSSASGRPALVPTERRDHQRASRERQDYSINDIKARPAYLHFVTLSMAFIRSFIISSEAPSRSARSSTKSFKRTVFIRLMAEKIAREVEAGSDLSRTSIELDRRKAIRRALEAARTGDIVVVAGKGHERVQHLPEGDIPFHDATVVRELLAEIRR